MGLHPKAIGRVPSPCNPHSFPIEGVTVYHWGAFTGTWDSLKLDKVPAALEEIWGKDEAA
jgi:hypothetical protein